MFGELQKDFDAVFIYEYNTWNLYVKVNSKKKKNPNEQMLNNVLIDRKYDVFMQ